MNRLYALKIIDVKPYNDIQARAYNESGYKVGNFMRFTRAEDQEPAMGFGNFDDFSGVPAGRATFCTTKVDIENLLSKCLRRVTGVRVDIAVFEEL